MVLFISYRLQIVCVKTVTFARLERTDRPTSEWDKYPVH
jgi:hypothetical protein